MCDRCMSSQIGILEADFALQQELKVRRSITRNMNLMGGNVTSHGIRHFA